MSKLAVITGASSGIGEAFVYLLAERGYSLLIIARREFKLKSLAEALIKKYPIEIEVLPADLTNHLDVSKVEKRISSLDSIDILINNAGFGLSGTFADKSPDALESMIYLHDTVPVRLCKAVLPVMKEQRGGVIINVASLAAFMPSLGSAVYSATKSFLVAFSQSLARQTKDYGILVQALCPGLTYSEFHSAAGMQRIYPDSFIQRMFWLSSEQVAKASLKALNNRRLVFIPGVMNRLGLFLIRLPFVALMLYKMVKKKKTI